MSELKLKPCPFCGSDMIICMQYPNGGHSGVCQMCGATGPTVSDDPSMSWVLTWNHRTSGIDWRPIAELYKHTYDFDDCSEILVYIPHLEQEASDE